ncbi:hypothetical protein UMM65_10120 [Aureibaculum sp. 2210JD6-5]|uniref:hypothetical protein n=1 Tax=Aureibaculum sp. 2210JD6-5 TaxID=3103957 RepID=UPI002AACC478|nr:hypothetical protein [Aureibaculum sp. 2210JD6-5]MDY7395598.1 hypothetical protein [Aureibaculum sp. 2210JD6-5]
MHDNKDKLEEKFLELRDQFDTEEPEVGHFLRFEERLAKQKPEKPKWNPTTWKWLAVAASIALIFSIGFNTFKPEPKGLELADVSPEMQETQSFFVSTIQNELKQVASKRNADNKEVIDDALAQLDILEKEYESLKVELKTSNEDNRVIYAMIANFQQRIEVLQFLLQQIDEIEQLKIQQNENTIT